MNLFTITIGMLVSSLFIFLNYVETLHKLRYNKLDELTKPVLKLKSRLLENVLQGILPHLLPKYKSRCDLIFGASIHTH